ncbi:Dna2/Cas4 domain-containing protein [Methanohalophilus sp.]|uniref:Dna2/Cas4 domain-containing protein n=1 Tax=Methanohalophilus sp. TaxID=1966352 RepID=UPI002616D011|nr:Dna2/Cas4 domain-containing protein [Methanohalophilus sp.]
MSEIFPFRYTKLSDVVNYLRCPRKVYFSSKTEEKQDISEAYLKHLLIREFAHKYPELLQDAADKIELVSAMRDRLQELAQELFQIHGPELELFSEAQMPGILREVPVENIASNLMAYVNEHGKKKVLKEISEIETEPIIVSKKLNLTGQIPAIVCLGEKPSPMLIKTGKAPENGIWKNDRIHLAASALLMGEHTGTHPTEGIVQYAAFGSIRKVRIHSTDRRNAINVIKKIEKIKMGTMPERKENPLCESCGFRESCISEPTSLLSRLF